MTESIPSFAARVDELLGDGRMRANVPLAPLTTFRVGGPAEWLVDVRTQEELSRVLAVASEHGVSVTLLGGGSNVLVADDGIRGLVVQSRLTGISLAAPDRVRAEAGVTINGLVRWTVGHGLAGLEAWAGTPGTVGGAIYGNAHWSGTNIGDRVLSVRLVSREGEIRDVDAADMEFDYDTSRLQRTKEVLVWADFKVSVGDTPALRAAARASLDYRKRTQPLARPSAGCVFRNPDPSRERLSAAIPPSAGALVDRAGLKGRRIGGARVSETHANFVVNDGGATAADVRALIELARATVREKFGVDLEDEVVYLGTF